jgi:hypothetical protein
MREWEVKLMFRRKLAILLLICFFLLFIKQGIAAETDSSQRDGPFVIAGQMVVGFIGTGTGGLIGVALTLPCLMMLDEPEGAVYPFFMFGGMGGGIFGCAGSVYAIGEIFGSGGGSFKATLKWSILTSIGATIGYQRSKRQKPPSVSLADGKFTLHLPTMSIQSSQLPYHHPQTDYMVRLVNVGF